MDSVLNETECNRIAEVIFQMTNKRYKNIDEEKLTQLHELCRESQIHIQRVYTLLIEYLKKPHAEIRYNAFYIFNKFFKMYRCFRNMAVEDLKIILDLCTDVNSNSELPLPKVAAKELKRFFLISIKNWIDEFGFGYMKLRLMYEYLQRKKHVDFVTLEIEDRANLRRREEERLKKERFDEEKLKSLRHEINDQRLEILNVTECLETCLKMLVPTPEEFFIVDEIENNENVDSCSQIEEHKDEAPDNSTVIEPDMNPTIFRETGMIKGNFTMKINLPKIEKKVTIIENEENAIIIENAKDHFKLLNKKLERVKNWIKNLTTLSGSTKELKIVIDLKISLENILKKYQCLTFEKLKSSVVEKDSDSEEDEMEDVIFQVPTADEKLIARLKEEGDQQPSTSGVTRSAENKTDAFDYEKQERKRKLLEVAPKLPFDVDLYYWEEENLSTPMLHPVTAEGRNFWLATAADDTTEGIPVPDGAASLRTRTIEFAGKFEPVKWSCRFPLPNGKLCSRQDRYKCPFHGTIVARDGTGKCVNLTDAKKDEELLSKLKYSEAQDPELLAQIKAATGIDLKLTGKNKRKKVDDSGLTDIKKEQDTVHRRLEKKIFKRSTVKRVARTLDNLDQKRFTDKFGDQFQYVHETTLG